jgi:hypothetical protein
MRGGRSPLGQEPVDVTAPVTYVTDGRRVRPVETEEGRDSGVQLGFTLPEPIVLADLAVQVQAGDSNLLRLLLTE